MSSLIQLASNATFFEVGMGLLVFGVAERVLFALPPNVVGPGGWLLDTGNAD
jgi:hypothetical protein